MRPVVIPPRDRTFGRTATLVRCCLALAMLCGAIPGARADTVASLLGNFTINQYCGVDLDANDVRVHYVVVFGQLPALRELHVADADGDGVTTQQERDAYVERMAPGYADQLKLTVDGQPVPLKATRWTSSLPTEQGGFSMRLDVDYVGALPADTGRRPAALHFDNRNFAGRIGWHELSVEASPGRTVYDTNAFGDSLTRGLTEALKTLPANGPLDERSIDLHFTDGAVPDGSRLLATRAASPLVASSTTTGDSNDRTETADTGDWLQRQTHRLVGLISTPTVAPHVAILALLAALLLGALHAFSPGHGKTIVGAYLIGSRSTPRHAVFLGFTVTVTHTIVVFAIGLATLFASRYVVPERLFPALSLLSGLLVLGMGIVLTMQRWKTARNAVAGLLIDRLERAFARRDAVRSGHVSIGGDALVMPSLRRLPTRATYGLSARRAAQHRHVHAGHDHGHGHGASADHVHGDGHADPHSHDTHDSGLMHSHGGGTAHSHLPPGASGEAVSWRSLLALGVSGGLVPCPSALVLLLAAIALNKTFYGILMVIAFSFGLALTLIVVGMLFLYARSRLKHPISTSVWPRVLPAMSGALITVVGIVLCYGAVTATGFGPLRT